MIQSVFNMLKSLHIGRYVAKAEDLRALAEFLEAIGFERLPGEDHRAANFLAPVGMLSVNALPAEYPAEVRDRLKDVNRIIVVEVSNPDDVFDIAQKRNLKVLVDSAAKDTGERSFSLELPGEIIVTVHGKPGVPLAAVEGELSAKGQRFGIVVSRFNTFITERLLQGALDGLRRTGARVQDIVVMRVPGSFELPVAARMMAQSGKYDAIIAIGCLLRGDTAHYDVIVNECARGIGQSAQETGVPHAFGVLTCDTLEQAIDRAGLKMGNKGFEAALAAVEMVNVKKAVAGRSSSVVGRRSSASPATANVRVEKRTKSTRRSKSTAKTKR